jgi:Ca2+/Na+ antiporter
MEKIIYWGVDIMTFLKQVPDKITEWNYCLDENNRHQSVIGWLLDAVLLFMTVFTISYLWFVYKTKIPVISVLLAASLSALSGYVYFRQRQRQLKKKYQEKWKKAAYEYRIKNLFKLNHKQFKWTLAKALLRIGIEDIKVENKHITAAYKNEKVMIGFYHVPYTSFVPAHEVFKLSRLMLRYGYKNGYFFTTSDFDDACRQAAQDTPGVTIRLINGNILVDIMDTAGIFDDKQAVDKYLTDKIKDYKLQGKQSLKQLLIKQKNAKTYIIYGFLYLGTAFVFPSYFIYFFLIALFFILLGILVYIASPSENHDPKEYDIKNHILQ